MQTGSPARQLGIVSKAVGSTGRGWRFQTPSDFSERCDLLRITAFCGLLPTGRRRDLFQPAIRLLKVAGLLQHRNANS